MRKLSRRNTCRPSVVTPLAGSQLDPTEAAAGVLQAEVSAGGSVEDREKFVSVTTGLTVISVTSSSSSPHHVIDMADRANIAKIFPEVVLINSCGNNDGLLLGVDLSPDQLRSPIVRAGEEMQNLNFSLVDVSAKDPFSFFQGWSLIPRVDKTGLYQLIINLAGYQGKANNKVNLSDAKRKIANMTKNFQVSKIVEGEGEMILLVSHVLEFILFSDCLSKEFSLEKRHTWQLKQRGTFENSNTEGANRFFIVKIREDQFNQLSPAAMQFNVNIRLKQLGRVLQLEQNIFGVPNNFLVVFSGKQNVLLSDVGRSELGLIEVFPHTFPECHVPNYGVDEHGFYSLAGKFPEDLSLNVRKKFSNDMRDIGAVGFRGGETEHHFSLHFINSRSIEQVSKLQKYSSFILKVDSSLIRKPKPEKEIIKMVPSILRLKQIQSKSSSPKPRRNTPVSTQENEAEALKKHSDENGKKTMKEMDEEGNEIVRKKVEKRSEAGKLKTEKEKKIIAKSKLKQVSIKGTIKPQVTCQLSEAELFNINWQQGKTLVNSLKSLAKFLDSVGVTSVELNEEKKDSDEVVFKIADKKKFIKVLKIYSRNETNSFDKLRSAVPRLVISANNKGMFGLTVIKTNDEKEAMRIIKTNYPSSKVEERAQVRIIWLPNKLDYFKILTDKAINLNFVPSIQNYTEVNQDTGSSEEILQPQPAPSIRSTGTEALKRGGKNTKVFKMSEKEVFGFIWRNLDEDCRIRDEQVVSRQLTEFIRNVKCSCITNSEEDGLVFHFTRKEDFDEVLSKYCPQFIGRREKFVSLTRKFTMIPSRGNYGIFSVRRVKQSDFSKFGEFKLHNNTLWFNNKLDVIAALRDPTIALNYPSIYIDCRNIFILVNAKTAVKNVNANFGKGFSSHQFMGIGYQITRRSQSQYRGDHRRDPAIIRSVAVGQHQSQSRVQCGSLLSQLLPTNIKCSSFQQAGSFKYDFMVGKFGVLPSNRVIKNGYKMYKSPQYTRQPVNSKLFLEDKDRYRNRKIEEAADDIKNILNGCDSKLNTSLKDIKMRRVELFLKERLGVEETTAGQGMADMFLSVVEGGVKEVCNRFEDVTEVMTEAEEDISKALIPDARGCYTLSIPFSDEDAELSNKLEDDLAWYEAPVSLLPIVDLITGRSILEVKMKNKEIVMAAYVALKDKYPGLKIDKTGRCCLCLDVKYFKSL